MEPPVYPGKKKWVVKKYKFDEIIDIRDSEGEIFITFQNFQKFKTIKDVCCICYLDNNVNTGSHKLIKLNPRIKDLPGYIKFKFIVDHVDDEAKVIIGYWS